MKPKRTCGNCGWADDGYCNCPDPCNGSNKWRPIHTLPDGRVTTVGRLTARQVIRDVLREGTPLVYAIRYAPITKGCCLDKVLNEYQQHAIQAALWFEEHLP